MADIMSSEKRSKVMSKIKGKDTRLEIIMRKHLHSCHIGFRKNYKALPGKPDIALTKWKTAIFINGCFWHGHEGCKYFVVPHTRTEWWMEKIEITKRNDKKNSELLAGLGWKVITFWECELEHDFDECVKRLIDQLQQ